MATPWVALGVRRLRLEEMLHLQLQTGNLQWSMSRRNLSLGYPEGQRAQAQVVVPMVVDREAEDISALSLALGIHRDPVDVAESFCPGSLTKAPMFSTTLGMFIRSTLTKS
jgi:hypothetical protein